MGIIRSLGFAICNCGNEIKRLQSKTGIRQIARTDPTRLLRKL